MAKSDLGTKRICPTTGKKFYDLNKNPVISPYTGEVVPIEVEIRTTSMIFQKGTRIRIDVLPHDNEEYFAAYHLGDNTIYTGGNRASYILLPVVPPRPGVEPDLGGLRSAAAGGGG